MAHDYTYFYMATPKYFCLSCGLSTRQEQCEKCHKWTTHTGYNTIRTGIKGKNKAKKRQKFGDKVRDSILDRREREWCGLHSNTTYQRVSINKRICPICRVEVRMTR